VEAGETAGVGGASWAAGERGSGGARFAWRGLWWRTQRRRCRWGQREAGELLQRRRREVAARVQDNGGEEGEGWGGGPHLGTA